MGVLLYREQIGCASVAVQGAYWLWGCCCKGRIFVVVLLQKEKIFSGIAAVIGAKCGGVLEYREQIGCVISDVKGAKCGGMLMYRVKIGCGTAAENGANCVGVLLYMEQNGC